MFERFPRPRAAATRDSYNFLLLNDMDFRSLRSNCFCRLRLNIWIVYLASYTLLQRTETIDHRRRPPNLVNTLAQSVETRTWPHKKLLLL